MVGRHKGRAQGKEDGGTEAALEEPSGEAGHRPVYRRYLIHPTVQIKRVLIDSSDLRIKYVNSKTVAF
jgi:hypothetical protein